MRVVTLADRKAINEAYARLGTYAAVSRELGFSPSTIKKYVDPAYKPDEGGRPIKRYDRPLPTFNFDVAKRFLFKRWDEMCELSDEEVEEIEELWGELDL